MKQIIKQVINGVEKLLVVEVIEEITVDTIKQEYEQLELDLGIIDDQILTNEQELESNLNLIKAHEDTIQNLNIKNVELKEDNINLEQNKLSINEKLEEIKNLLNQVIPTEAQDNQNVEQLHLPLEDEIVVEDKISKDEAVEPEVQVNTTHSRNANRRFGRFGR